MAVDMCARNLTVPVSMYWSVLEDGCENQRHTPTSHNRTGRITDDAELLCGEDRSVEEKDGKLDERYADCPQGLGSEINLNKAIN